MLPLLLLAIGPAAMASDWDTSSQWRVTSDIQLPAVMWVRADRNIEARMMAWQLDAVLDCGAAEAVGRSREVGCEVQQVALRGAALPADAGKLQVVLDEADDALTGAVIRLRFGPTGQLRGVGLEGLEVRNRARSAMQENLRLMVSRAVAGFDLPTSDPETSVWRQKGTWILQLPADAGTLAGGAIEHERTQVDAERQVVQSRGRATLQPFSGNPGVPSVHGPVHTALLYSNLPPTGAAAWNEVIGMDAKFTSQLTARAVFHRGALQERTWSTMAEPTPSARISQGAEGYMYRQQGHIQRIEDTSVALGETIEIPFDGPAPTALQTWETLGASW